MKTDDLTELSTSEMAAVDGGLGLIPLLVIAVIVEVVPLGLIF